MAGGRPTREPKETLVAVRLSERHMAALRARAERQGVSVSEALRRYLDEAIASSQIEAAEPPLKKEARIEPRQRRPTPEERKVFDQVFAVFGIVPRARRRPSRRP